MQVHPTELILIIFHLPQNQSKISIKSSDPGKSLKLHLWFNNSNYCVTVLNLLSSSNEIRNDYSKRTPHKINLNKICHPQYLDYIWIGFISNTSTSEMKWRFSALLLWNASHRSTTSPFLCIRIFLFFQVKVRLKPWSVLKQCGNIRSWGSKG